MSVVTAKTPLSQHAQGSIDTLKTVYDLTQKQLEKLEPLLKYVDELILKLSTEPNDESKVLIHNEVSNFVRGVFEAKQELKKAAKAKLNKAFGEGGIEIPSELFADLHKLGKAKLKQPVAAETNDMEAAKKAAPVAEVAPASNVNITEAAIREIEQKYNAVLVQVREALSIGVELPAGERSELGQKALTTVIDNIIGEFSHNPFLQKDQIAAYLQRNLAAEISDHNQKNNDSPITQGDVAHFQENIALILKNKNASELKDNLGFADFLKGNNKWLIALVPLLAGPLSHLFACIPLVGGTLNTMLNQLYQSTGSIMTGLVMSAFNGKGQAGTGDGKDSKVA